MGVFIQEMPRTTGVIDRFNRFGGVCNFSSEGQGRHDKFTDRQRREKLPLGLLNAVVEKKVQTSHPKTGFGHLF